MNFDHISLLTKTNLEISELGDVSFTTEPESKQVTAAELNKHCDIVKLSITCCEPYSHQSCPTRGTIVTTTVVVEALLVVPEGVRQRASQAARPTEQVLNVER